ncbi:2-(5'-triphosphoribosyl)-3'-dephospho CoA synthase [Actinobacillus succinogenes]|uniref:Probable 2-(5''-triphosphoribosyl)-3'-dephosphocoenzyme-A synthase n=1 Tax=Actinobacillus succinogenes (strain ATCC 55618 / DSM 22257 / CCUG 43843 / 130Z) TaxID=339671 RepID=A6VNL5_ACTSZ|nr:triphosphoribosyl-dephospho-CoA synthase CitG [Actinobacillus succinogenes]ABR74562.1 Holo-ACP synthase, Triphosphoribosyl-dephospho-CoA synthase [Actinobacillus succinogenes 130Z]PHI41017.1 2-(5'-triphosphoribosyl)-3'-dephospho CoA synthase [Actinobacillus succinogenes]
MFSKFFKIFSRQGQEIALEQLLAAREARVSLQQQCLEKYDQTVLSLTLLAAGGVKKNELLDYVFEKALQNLTALFAALNVEPAESFIRPLETGHEALFVLPVEAATLKRAAMRLEDSSPLARLWDIDVIAADGRLLSRTEFDFPPRPCLVCSDNAKSCARSRKHGFEEIYAEMQRRVQADYFADQIADGVYHALVGEARLSPKPGLVDSLTNGAHKDMNLQTFEQSAAALRPFFAKFVLAGMASAEFSESEVLATIRPLGLEAEKAMFRATANVNTHKGAIFAFGLVCAAIGRIYVHHDEASIEHICRLVSAFTQGLTAELEHYPAHLPETAGVKLYREFGLTGARGEAESGFAIVRQNLSVLEQNQTAPSEPQLLIMLLTLMAENQDTNVVHRGGMAGLDFVQNRARALLEQPKIRQNPTALYEALTAFDSDCIERNLSPGGSADLLALTIFFYFLART